MGIKNTKEERLLNELNNQELELVNIVISINGTIEEKETKIIKCGVSEKFKPIHQAYAQLSENNLEALKRGLFLSWYSISEPFFLTGIGPLDKSAENKIIHSLDLRLHNNTTDYELDWMLDYYLSWEYIFEGFENYTSFHQRFIQKSSFELPARIDKETMQNRGQMGLYWTSIF